MLENIKSLKVFKIIFSFVEERIKLGIIIYNKKMKYALNRNINYYKRVNDSELNIDKNGFGTRRSLNEDGKQEITLEGQYKNGKKNGKGKEYFHIFSNKIFIFEGTFKNGKKNGKGKEYFDIPFDKKLLLEEFKNGEKKRKGNKYYDNSLETFLFQTELLAKTKFEYYPSKAHKLIFEGEYKDGKRNGKGKEYQDEKLVIFEGEYLKGERWNGIVKNYDQSKNIIFEGEYKNGKIWNGKGYKSNNDAIDYEIINGNGIIKECSNILLECELKNGEKTGKAKVYYGDKLIFEGEYLKGKKNGKGKEYFSNGKLKFESIYIKIYYNPL